MRAPRSAIATLLVVATLLCASGGCVGITRATQHPTDENIDGRIRNEVSKVGNSAFTEDVLTFKSVNEVNELANEGVGQVYDQLLSGTVNSDVSVLLSMKVSEDKNGYLLTDNRLKSMFNVHTNKNSDKPKLITAEDKFVGTGTDNGVAKLSFDNKSADKTHENGHHLAVITSYSENYNVMKGKILSVTKEVGETEKNSGQRTEVTYNVMHTSKKKDEKTRLLQIDNNNTTQRKQQNENIIATYIFTDSKDRTQDVVEPTKTLNVTDIKTDIHSGLRDTETNSQKPESKQSNDSASQVAAIKSEATDVTSSKSVFPRVYRRDTRVVDKIVTNKLLNRRASDTVALTNTSENITTVTSTNASDTESIVRVTSTDTPGLENIATVTAFDTLDSEIIATVPSTVTSDSEDIVTVASIDSESQEMSTVATTEVTTVKTPDTKDALEKVNTSVSPNQTTALPFDLYDRHLPCARADDLSKPFKFSRCEYEWEEGRELPQIRCELVAPVNSYAGLIYSIATYGTVGERTPSGRLCVYLAYHSVSWREALGELRDSVLRDPSESELLQILRSEPNTTTLTVMLSQGFRELALRMRPDAIGPRGLLNAEPCRDCTPDVWIFQYKKDNAVLALYMNRAYSISMLFKPAYVRLAAFWSKAMTPDALLEDMEVKGGENWGDPGSDFLPALRFLRRIDFSGNGLSALPAENFKRNLQLQEVHLANNQLTTVPDGIPLLADLRILNLAGNRLLVSGLVPALRPLGELRTLNLSQVPLEGFEVLSPSAVAVGRNSEATNALDHEVDNAEMLPRLETLDVSWSNISDANSSAARSLWRGWRRLRELRLSGNQLRVLPSDLPAQLPALHTLELSHCALRAAPLLRLSPSQRLRRLDLSRNALHSPEGALAPHAAGDGVHHLDLSGNPLTFRWGVDAFLPLGANASVNLSRAELTSFSEDMLQSFKHLRRVDLGGNPIDCMDCAVVNLQSWLRGTRRAKVVVMGQEQELRCMQLQPDRGSQVVNASEPPSDICNPVRQGTGTVVATVVAGVVSLGALVTLALLSYRFRLELKYMLNVMRANRSLNTKASDSDGNIEERDEFDAFVCYSKHDRAFVLGELLPHLEDINPPYKLCLHERDFPLGSLIVQNIVECMARSRRTIVVLTHAFVDSQWCQWELEMATHRILEGANDFLVLLKLEPLEARTQPMLLRMLLETRTVLEWPTSVSKGALGDGGAMDVSWQRLRVALGPPLQPTRRQSRRPSRRQSRQQRVAPATPVVPAETPAPVNFIASAVPSGPNPSAVSILSTPPTTSPVLPPMSTNFNRPCLVAEEQEALEMTLTANISNESIPLPPKSNDSFDINPQRKNTFAQN